VVRRSMTEHANYLGQVDPASNALPGDRYTAPREGAFAQSAGMARLHLSPDVAARPTEVSVRASVATGHVAKNHPQTRGPVS
jgi:hypothetical protein